MPTEEKHDLKTKGNSVSIDVPPYLQEQRASYFKDKNQTIKLMIVANEFDPQILLAVAFKNKDTAHKTVLKKKDIFTDKQRDYIKFKLKQLKQYRDNP